MRDATGLARRTESLAWPWAVVVAAVLPGLPATAAPKLKGGDGPPLYFPTTVGDRWVSARTSGGRVTEVAEEVTAVADKGGQLLVTVRQTETGVRDHVYQYAASVTGVSLAALDEEAFDPPVPLLRLPARAGDTWDR